MMRRKIDILRDMMTAGQWRDALKLAGSWPDACDDVRKGKEAMLRPDFQRQLGRDVEALKAAGIEALKRRFG